MSSWATGVCGASRCVIEDGKRGICQVRENRGGRLYTLVYGWTLVQQGSSREETVVPLLSRHNGLLHCGAVLQPVLDTLQTMKRLGIWVEVTTLVIPGIISVNHQHDQPQARRETVKVGRKPGSRSSPEPRAYSLCDSN